MRLIFLNWLPWLLCMSRPRHPLCLKTLLMRRKLKEDAVPRYNIIYKDFTITKKAPTRAFSWLKVPTI